MNSFVNSWIDEHSNDITETLRGLVRIKSISGPAEGPGAPFGAGCRDALEYVLNVCGGLGFAVTNMDGYIGYADCGEGSEMLAVLTHLDVVPEGENWRSGPYEGNVIDGRMVGRGTLDDKGPAVAAMYALAAVMASGLPFKRSVRLLFGCDEEKGMGCLSHYEKHGRMPDLAFSPDAEYPLVNSEKNIFHAHYKKDYASAVAFKAGTVVNAVPGRATAFVPVALETVSAAAVGMAGFTFGQAENGTSITALGEAAHASMPESGINAIQRLVSLLVKLPLPEADAKVASGLWQAFGLECHGESVGLDSTDASGRLTLNVGLMDWNEKGFAMDLDIRAPISVTHDMLLAKLDAAFAAFGAQRESDTFSAGYCVPEDSELVQKLLKVYRERTGDMSAPKRIGGGTYARHLKNAVAFGPERDYRENRVHMVDESIPLADLIEDAKMLANALIELACE